MELELRHLRVLCAIADAGSVGRAAALLGASQPATSTQLRRIERHLGAPLFERTALGVAPTCFGVEVLAAARDLLMRADGLGRRPDSPDGPARRELRLAATNSPMLPGLVTRARQQRPDQRFTVTSVYRSSDIVDLLEQGTRTPPWPWTTRARSCATRRPSPIAASSPSPSSSSSRPTTGSGTVPRSTWSTWPTRTGS